MSVDYYTRLERGKENRPSLAVVDLFDDWHNQVRGCVARLRALAGTDPDAPDLTRLVGEFLLKSPEFTRFWESYDTRAHAHGRKGFHHPEVGDVTLGHQSMLLEGTPGFTPRGFPVRRIRG